MASLESLSDGELRTRLTNLGCDVGPVTPTTRKLYLKKLKNLLDNPNASSVSTASRSSVASFNDSNDTFASPKAATGKSTPRRKSPSRKPELHAPLANSTFADSPSRVPVSRADVLDGGQPNLNSYAAPISPSSVPGIGSKYQINQEDRSVAEPSLPFRRNADLRRPKLNVPSSSLKKDFDSSQPYSSEFARQISMSVAASRLAAGSTVSPRASLSSKPYDSYDKYDNVKENDSEDEDPDRPQPTYTKLNRSSRSYQRGNGSSYMAMGEKWYGKDASLLILGAAALFFLIISYIYFHMHHNPSTQVSPQVSELSYPRCDSVSLPYDESCIPDHMIKPVTMVFRLVHKELHDMAANAGCQPSELPFLYKLDVEKLVSDRETSMTVWDVEEFVKRARLLVDANPRWNLVSTSDGIRLRSLPPSIYCTIVGYFLIAADWILRFSIVALAVGLGYGGYRWNTQRQANRHSEICRLAADIVQAVSERASGDGFAVISHIRDALIPHSDRQRMASMWKEAEAMLENDSRLRKEVQPIEGEEFLVWRWVASANPAKNKGWQGQAFETMEGSPNSVPESPTPCLKIRHMFDPSQEAGDKWIGAVADAVLEKCKGAAIIHIVVDRTSSEGCVYVKCASHADAGIAYRALHGSWFNSKLVTVKYVREARYLERFPDSAQARYTLSPSSKGRS